jgi:hypothetical protein
VQAHPGKLKRGRNGVFELLLFLQNMFTGSTCRRTRQPFNLLDYRVDNKLVVLQIRHTLDVFWNNPDISPCVQNETVDLLKP